MVKDIPDSIKVDLSKVEDIFTIGDLDLPAGVKASLDPERHIAHVTIVQEAAEEVEGIAEGAEDAAPEVISGTPDTNEGDSE